jgi:hypothetical protein
MIHNFLSSAFCKLNFLANLIADIAMNIDNINSVGKLNLLHFLLKFHAAAHGDCLHFYTSIIFCTLLIMHCHQ